MSTTAHNLHLDITKLLEGIPHAAMLLDKNSSIVWMNRIMEAISGFSHADVVGLHGELVIRSNTGNYKGQLYRQVIETGKALSVRGDIINYNRKKIPIQYTISPQFIRKNIFGLLVIIEDISLLTGSNDSILGQNNDTADFIGYSVQIQKVFELIPLMAQTDASVMITGETGTGKDKIAEIIHKNSSRSRHPFIKINCGALPAGLLESELFGHVKGAFTGATRKKAGMFELANKGTVFLTEIGDMPYPLQVKLLSFLDDKEFVPVGGEEKISVDVRIIAATHRPLRQQIQNNEFREDLFYRLHVLHIDLPPLREREDDVRILLEHFLQKFSHALNKTIVGFTPNAMQKLLSYAYPGNIRELKNIVEYSVNICKKKKITSEFLPQYVLHPPILEEKIDESPLTNREENNISVLPVQGTNNNDKSWQDIERELIIKQLTKHGGHRTKTAKSLKWGRMKLWRKMKQYNLL